MFQLYANFSFKSHFRVGVVLMMMVTLLQQMKASFVVKVVAPYRVIAEVELIEAVQLLK